MNRKFLQSFYRAFVPEIQKNQNFWIHFIWTCASVVLFHTPCGPCLQNVCSTLLLPQTPSDNSCLSWEMLGTTRSRMALSLGRGPRESTILDLVVPLISLDNHSLSVSLVPGRKMWVPYIRRLKITRLTPRYFFSSLYRGYTFFFTGLVKSGRG